MDAFTISLIFYTFLPCFVIAGVGLAIYFIMRVLPEDLQDFLNFDMTNPKKNKRRKK